MDPDHTRLLLNGTTNQNGHRPLRAAVGTLASFIVLLLASSSVSAATLNVVGGQLLGATDVIVDGSPFNVEFLDGTCVDLYNGCDAVSDFTFQSEAAALLASQALLDLVFVDGPAGLFDARPELTNGCENVFLCIALTPFVLGSPGTVVTVSARNFAGAGDFLSSIVVGVTSTDTSTIDRGTWAIWAPVPEPGTAVLMGLGLLGLSVRKRQEV